MSETDTPTDGPAAKPKRGRRKALSAKTRFEVFKRDKFTCQYCGAHPPQVLLHVDHIIAVAAGGSNDEGNLVTACEPCNLGKGARSLGSTAPSLKAQAERAADMEAQLRGYQDTLAKKRLRMESELDQLDKHFGVFFPGKHFTPRFRLSLKVFVEKLGAHEVMDAVEKAGIRCNTPDWAAKYMCSICWRLIREQSE